MKTAAMAAMFAWSIFVWVPAAADENPGEQVLLASDARKIYWGSLAGPSVRRSSPDGSNVEVLVARDGSNCIAVDNVHGKIYWCDPHELNIKRSDLDGRNIQVLVSHNLTYNPGRIALDVAGGKMYWTDEFRPIHRANLDGSDIEDLLATPSRQTGIALDVANGKMYWSEAFSDTIRRANLDGSGAEDVVHVTFGSGVTDIALDLKHKTVYWTDFRHQEVGRANLDGSHVQKVIGPLPDSAFNPEGIALDVNGGKVYWTASGPLPDRQWRVQVANLDGTGGTSVFVSPYYDEVLLDIEFVEGVSDNPSPVAVCQDISVSAGEGCLAEGSVDDGSFDPDNDPITLRQTPAGPYKRGRTEIFLTATDDRGASDYCTAILTVVDTTPPVMTCPSAVLAECSSSHGTIVTIPAASVSDDCDSSPWVVNSHTSGGQDASGFYSLGQTEVVMTARDVSGNQSSCSFPVTVRDTTPPQISLGLRPAILWPPSHTMVDIVGAISATDACSNPSVSLSGVTSTEPDDAPGPGDGNTGSDIQGTDFGTADFNFQLRAEREGNGPGRTYTVTYTAVDASGNPTQAHAIIVVPHDLGGSTEPLDLSAQEGFTGTLLAWSPVPGATAYNVVRGNVRSLRLASDFIDVGAVSCIQSGSSQTSTSDQEDGEIPAPGEAFFYLASYNDGRDSGYGSASAAKPRMSTVGGCE